VIAESQAAVYMVKQQRSNVYVRQALAQAQVPVEGEEETEGAAGLAGPQSSLTQKVDLEFDPLVLRKEGGEQTGSEDEVQDSDSFLEKVSTDGSNGSALLLQDAPSTENNVEQGEELPPLSQRVADLLSVAPEDAEVFAGSLVVPTVTNAANELECVTMQVTLQADRGNDGAADTAEEASLETEIRALAEIGGSDVTKICSTVMDRETLVPQQECNVLKVTPPVDSSLPELAGRVLEEELAGGDEGESEGESITKQALKNQQPRVPLCIEGVPVQSGKEGELSLEELKKMVTDAQNASAVDNVALIRGRTEGAIIKRVEVEDARSVASLARRLSGSDSKAGAVFEYQVEFDAEGKPVTPASQKVSLPSQNDGKTGDKNDGKRGSKASKNGGKNGGKGSKKSLKEVFGFEDGFELSNITGAGWALIAGGAVVLALLLVTIWRACCYMGVSAATGRSIAVERTPTNTMAPMNAAKADGGLPRFITLRLS
jgi:hypothetical protein